MPSFLLSMLLALSIDYAIFMLTRYREALDDGHDKIEAVEEMLRSAGKTVLVCISAFGSALVVCHYWCFHALT